MIFKASDASSVTDHGKVTPGQSTEPEKISSSIPVGSTILLPVNGNLVNGAPLSDTLSLLSQALGDAAKVLAAAVSALSGQNGSRQLTAPTLSLPTTRPSFSGTLCPTVRDCVNELLVAKARAGRADRYVRQLRVSLKSFAAGRGQTPLDEVSISDVERWLFGHDWALKTQRGYLSDVRTLFRFAMRRGYLEKDISRGVELSAETIGQKPPGIHTPEQARIVLEAARAADLDVMRHLAVRYFAGVRSAEAHRLRECDLHLDRGFIEVSAAKSKTRQRRLVKILPCLAAWLALGGTLRPMSDKTVRRVIKASGVPWPQNCTRHSFVSYHLAAFENAGKTALQSGHSEAMLFAHYREVVTPETAKEFWAIVPG